MIALIAVGSVLGYSLGIGVTYAVCKHRGWEFGAYNPEDYFAVVAWPLILPVLLGVAMTDRLLRPKRDMPQAKVVRR